MFFLRLFFSFDYIFFQIFLVLKLFSLFIFYFLICQQIFLLYIINSYYNIYMLFAGWEVGIVKNCDQGLENAARGRRPMAAFSRPRSQFFTIRTDPKPVNNLLIFFLLG